MLQEPDKVMARRLEHIRIKRIAALVLASAAGALTLIIHVLGRLL